MTEDEQNEEEQTDSTVEPTQPSGVLVPEWAVTAMVCSIIVLAIVALALYGRCG